MPVWSPQLGPQAEATAATWCEELFFGGARGGGKSDYLLGDFLQDVPRYGKGWQGVIFRRTYPELQQLILRSQSLYPQTGATWREIDKEWRWGNGACLRMRYLERSADASRYQGHEFTWIGWDELTQWADDSAYKMLMACLRSSFPIPTKRIRASGNPGGAGHQWVKARFVDHAPLGHVPIKDAATGMHRMFIPSKVSDNRILLLNDPTYIQRLQGVGSPELVRAWLEGDWSAVTGAYFPEFGARHIVDPVKLPDHWLRFTSYDHGSARPFAHYWHAVSDGTEKWPKGAIITYRELYGASEPNVGVKWPIDRIAQKILSLEQSDEQIAYRVADPACWKEDGGPSIAEMFSRNGVYFRPADNSRLAGWEQMRLRLVGEERSPMWFMFSTCTNLIRTLPSVQHDDGKPEDLDTESEDHALDSCRYGLMSRPYVAVKVKEEPVRDIRGATLNELWEIHERDARDEEPCRV